MQRKMSVPEVTGNTQGEKFKNALKVVMSVSPERAAEIRNHIPKHHSKPSQKRPKAGAH